MFAHDRDGEEDECKVQPALELKQLLQVLCNMIDKFKLEKLENYHIPKYGSLLNIAEIESKILDRQYFIYR